jgi:hypothetical protein
MNQAATDGAVSVIDYVIGENVATLQRRAGLTNAQVGNHFGVSGPAMSLKLHGKRAWSALDVQRAASLFGVRMAQLTGEEPMPEPTAPASVTDISGLVGRRRSVGRTGLEPVTDGLWVAPVAQLDDIRARRETLAG